MITEVFQLGESGTMPPPNNFTQLDALRSLKEVSCHEKSKSVYSKCWKSKSYTCTKYVSITHRTLVVAMPWWGRAGCFDVLIPRTLLVSCPDWIHIPSCSCNLCKLAAFEIFTYPPDRRKVNFTAIREVLLTILQSHWSLSCDNRPKNSFTS